jgi:hypothetical protein
MQETPYTETFTRIELHVRVINEKVAMHANLGILREVFNEVEDLVEIRNNLCSHWII